jgi:hypothetical protein
MGVEATSTGLVLAGVAGAEGAGVTTAAETGVGATEEGSRLLGESGERADLGLVSGSASEEEAEDSEEEGETAESAGLGLV